MKDIGKAPYEMLNENIALTPVDDCARAVVSLMLGYTQNSVYNLFSKYSMTIGEYLNSLDVIDSISFEEYRNLLQKRTDAQSQFMLMYVSGIEKDPKKSVVDLITSKTNNNLHKIGFNWEKLNVSYVQLFEKLNCC